MPTNTYWRRMVRRAILGAPATAGARRSRTRGILRIPKQSLMMLVAPSRKANRPRPTLLARGAVVSFGLIYSAVLGASASDVDSITFAAPKFSKLSQAEKALLLEYDGSFSKLKAVYENLQSSAAERWYRPVSGSDEAFPAGPLAEAALVRVLDVTFRSNGGAYFRIDEVRRDPKNTGHVVLSRTGIITPEQSYLIGHDLSNNETPFLLAHGDNKNEYMDLLRSYVLPVAAFSDGQVAFHETLLEGEEMPMIESVSVDGDGVVSVATSFKSGDWSGGSVLKFLRNQCWALLEVRSESVNQKEPDRLVVSTQRCVYDGSEHGVPLLKECVFEDASRSAGDRSEKLAFRRVFQVTKVVPRPAPLSEFDIARIIKNKVGATSTGAVSNFRIVLVATGIVLVIIATLLRKGSKSMPREAPK